MKKSLSTREEEWNANAVLEQANRAMRAEQELAKIQATLIWMSGELAKKDREIALLQAALKEARA